MAAPHVLNSPSNADPYLTERIVTGYAANTLRALLIPKKAGAASVTVENTSGGPMAFRIQAPGVDGALQTTGSPRPAGGFWAYTTDGGDSTRPPINPQDWTIYIAGAEANAVILTEVSLHQGI